MDTNFEVEYTPPVSAGVSRPPRRATVAVTDMDSRDPEWHVRLGISARVAKRKVESVANALRAMGDRLEHESGWRESYCSTGLLLRPDEAPVFLRQGGEALSARGPVDLRCQLPGAIQDAAGIKALTVDDPSEETFAEDLATMFDVLDVAPHDPAMPYALLSQLAWAPWSGIREYGPVAVAVAGETGARKTAVCGLSVAAQSQTFSGGPGVEVPVTVKMRGNQSTVFGVDQVLYHLGGLVTVVDDYFAGKMSTKDVADGWKRLSLIGDNAATGVGPLRGGYRNGTPTIAKTSFPRSCLLVTAEEFPDEEHHGSEIGRYVALRMRGAVNTDVLSRMQANGRRLSRAHATMIQRGLADLTLPAQAKAWAQEAMENWRFEGHNRVQYGYLRLLAGWWLMTRHAGVIGLDPDSLRADAVQVLGDAAADQARRNGLISGRQLARDPITLWTKHLREMITGDPYWIASDQLATQSQDTPDTEAQAEYRVPNVPNFGPAAMGWRQMGQSGGWSPAGRGEPIGAVHARKVEGRAPWRDVILRMPAGRFNAIHEEIGRRSRSIDGWGLPSSEAMRVRLVEEGILKAVRGESLPLWEGKRSCLSLDLMRILEPEPEPGGEEPPGDEAGTDAPSQGGPQVPEGGEDDSQGGPQEAPGGPPEAPGLFPVPGPRQDPQEAPEPAMTGAQDAGSPMERDPVSTGDRGPFESGAPTSGPETIARVPRARGRKTAVKADATARGLGVVGVIDIDGLRISGSDDVISLPCLPACLEAAYRIACKYGIGQLWFTARATEAMGLPDPSERPEDIPLNAGIKHPWAELDGTGLESDPHGVAPWIVVWETSGDRRATSRSIALPWYEERAPWRDALHGGALLEAIIAFNTAIGHDYYLSPNTTTSQLIRRHTRDLKPCLAIIEGRVPPAVRHPQMVRAKWSRTPLDTEQGSGLYLHSFDLTAAELSAMDARYGVGEPEHRHSPEIDTGLPGYWRLARVPTGLRPELPELRFQARDDGSIWITSVDVQLLVDLGRDVQVVEAWVWPTWKRWLGSTYTVLQKGREALLEGRDKGAPESPGEVAFGVHRSCYTRMIGSFAYSKGPRGRDDALWRPDVRDILKAQTYTRAYRSMLKIGQESGRWPVATSVDAAYYVSPHADPAQAAPAGMVLGTRGGQWQPERRLMWADVADVAGEDTFHQTVARELSRQKGMR
ncbi:hypothetical protein [Embleya sp. NPDC005575]|uniref:hypothetical protein n=1 Tax=Embleya sp. NPDC005575 TaxID=3156892 RepID=UPI0033BB2C7A